MARVLGVIVVLILLMLAAKLALAALSFMAVATTVGACGILAVGVFSVTRFFMKKRK